MSNRLNRLIIRTLVAAVLLVAAQASHAQDLRLARRVSGTVANGSPRVYALTARAGEVTSGALTLQSGGSVSVEARDAAGGQLAIVELSQAGELPFGFLARRSGTVRVHVTASGSAPATFSLETKTETPAARMAAVHVRPRILYRSPRIERLASDIKAAGAVTRFWQEMEKAGTPLIEPYQAPARGRGAGGGGAAEDDHALVTFLWRQTYQIFNVAVIRPPFSSTDYYMTRLAGTDVWYKTMRVHRSSRFWYQVAPNRRDDDNGVTAVPDPLNKRPFSGGNNGVTWASLLELDRAPDASWAQRLPPRRGVVEPKTFDSKSLAAELRLHIYTPPGFSASGGPHPLVVLFDGPAYATGFINAPTTLDNLIAAGRIRPPVVCFVSSATSAGNRAANLNLNPAFNAAIARELVPWLRSTYAVSTNPRDVVIGGYSAGARAATDIALDFPDVFGNVLSQSGAFRGGQLQTRYIRTDRAPIRFYLDVGLYDNVPSASLPLDESSLDYGLIMANRHFRDVLLAKGYDVTFRETGGAHEPIHWSATLPEALMTLLALANR